ncbi:hypothetical protein OAT42_02105 [Alphaproteobacteria bacterium]|jgi:hypothetical protein|nr:hypothetical protein [Alphaproteobacteria bacterium]|tara:strand:+ start:2517 stop:2717 length:201 start_codon:yes stop_codon:yes gene_type:complete
MSKKIQEKNKDEYKSFKIGNYKIRIRKKTFKYTLIFIIIIFIGFPYLDLKMPTHSLTDLQNSKEIK